MESVLLLGGLAGIAWILQKSETVEKFAGAGGAGGPEQHPGDVRIRNDPNGHSNMRPQSRVKQNNSGLPLSGLQGGVTEDVRVQRGDVAHFGVVAADSTNPTGFPSTSDFIQSRVTASSRAHNYFPEEQKNVGPGLGLGYTTDGAGGFQQLESFSRDAIKKTDELRIASNPKLTYATEPVPGGAIVGKRHEGPSEVPKNRPDKFYPDGPERSWNTQPGLERGPTSLAEPVIKDENRETTDIVPNGVDMGPMQSAAAGWQSYVRPLIKEIGDFTRLTVGPFFSPGEAYTMGVRVVDADRRSKLNLSRPDLETQHVPVAHGDKTSFGKKDITLPIKKDESMAFNDHVTNPSRLNQPQAGAEMVGKRYVKDRLPWQDRVDDGKMTVQLASNPYHNRFNPAALASA